MSERRLSFGRRAVTAAAFTVPQRELERMPRAPQAWQTRAWRLWRILGVLHFPTSFKAKQVGRLKWNVEVNGELLEEEAADKAIAAVTAPMSPAEASRRLALNFEVAGEVWYARAGDDWRVYAATTPKLKELLAAADIRVHGIQPDPENPTEPSSTIQAALGTAEQIRLMAALSRSQDRNRLSQRGILLIPKEGQFPEGSDFQAQLEETMTAPIADEYAPSAVVPLKVDFPGEWIEKWRHLVIESPYDDKLMERIDRAIVQFAREIDMPPEVLLGNMDSNHWNAWLSSEDNYRGHVEPLGTLVGEVYAEAMMAAVDQAATIVVTPDPADLLARRSSVEDAFTALQNLVVGFDYVRNVMGADEDDAPTPDEVELILAMLGKTPPGETPVQEAPEMPASAPAPSSNGNGVQAALPGEPDLERLAHNLSDLDMQLRGRLHAAAEMAADIALQGLEPDTVGLQERVAAPMDRLGAMWRRELASGRRALRALGVDAEGPEWDEAAEFSVALLTDGMSAWVLEQVGKTPSELPEIPGDLLRRVLAAAGGSDTAVVAALPAPTTQDALGFAVGVLSSKSLKAQGLVFTQWRFRYGTLHRSEPFREHKAQDGRFATVEGTVNGWYPGDHRGCLCGLTPVLRLEKVPQEA